MAYEPVIVAKKASVKDGVVHLWLAYGSTHSFGRQSIALGESGQGYLDRSSRDGTLSAFTKELASA